MHTYNIASMEKPFSSESLPSPPSRRLVRSWPVCTCVRVYRTASTHLQTLVADLTSLHAELIVVIAVDRDHATIIIDLCYYFLIFPSSRQLYRLLFYLVLLFINANIHSLASFSPCQQCCTENETNNCCDVFAVHHLPTVMSQQWPDSEIWSILRPVYCYPKPNPNTGTGLSNFYYLH